ncbi:MAG: prepilin-type N-terminal cleavage/methylation domain-containing protein [Gammaproteobacteria bacterium]|nr:prepilin-type N-terminal cleavage/methylation domain-containing protein [Gammaproteobacteria bacterium]
MMKKQQAGFTLIEIAIVLVIIGLLLGGVLKGQEMINNSKIKRAVNDFNGVSAAVYSYLDRYGALPGDEPTASTNPRWTVPGGNGNGVITGTCGATNGVETARLWVHLRNSGLVAGATTDNAAGRQAPNNAFGGITCVKNGGFGLTGTVICQRGIDGKFAAIIDRQLDDGNAATGSVRGGTANNPGVGSATVPYAEGAVGNICTLL